MLSLDKALAGLKKGSMILIYDGDEREGEADLIFHARFAKPERIETLRKNAGGLICLAIEGRVAKDLDLPFYTDILTATRLPIAAMECTKTAYGDRPAFAIPINSKNVYTGITDKDRALTIRSMAELVESPDGRQKRKERFMGEFYSPGHVFLLIGRGIENRHGHTELSLELAKRAGMSGVMVLCEMLGKGNALSKKEASAYAKRHGLAFLEGKDILKGVVK